MVPMVNTQYLSGNRLGEERKKRRKKKKQKKKKLDELHFPQTAFLYLHNFAMKE